MTEPDDKRNKRRKKRELFQITSAEFDSDDQKQVLDETNSELRTVWCGDALEWLETQHKFDGAVITSIPDLSELRWKSGDNYKSWFTNVASLILSKLTDTIFPAIFYSTDSKVVDANGVCSEWIDKSFLLHTAAKQQGFRLLWHKVAGMDRYGEDVNATNRVTYAHVLCFTPTTTTYNLNSIHFPDMFERGRVVWSRGMGLNATLYAVQFLKTLGITKVIDPFCGRGTVLAAANFEGLQAVGVELNPKIARYAFKLKTDIFEGILCPSKSTSTEQLQGDGRQDRQPGIERNSTLKVRNALSGTQECGNPSSTHTCTCGNIFMADSRFCRLCGQARVIISA